MKTIVKIKHTVLTIQIFLMLAVVSAFGQDAQQKAQEYYRKGNYYYDQGMYTQAQEEFKKALDLLNQKEPLTPEGAAPPVQPVIAPSQPFASSLKHQPARREVKEYTIGEDDVLRISVWQNPDLDQEAIVRPDGRISFPLIGDIEAAGLTITQLHQDMTQRLKEYIKFPEVSISIKKIGGQKVLVLGEVADPGVYSVTGAKTILEAVSLAGGFTKDAVLSSVVVITGGFEKPAAKRINLSQALRGNARENIALHSEDIVYVPKKFIANLNYFLSQVLDPLSRGAYLYREAIIW